MGGAFADWAPLGRLERVVVADECLEEVVDEGGVHVHAAGLFGRDSDGVEVAEVVDFEQFGLRRVVRGVEDDVEGVVGARTRPLADGGRLRRECFLKKREEKNTENASRWSSLDRPN